MAASKDDDPPDAGRVPRPTLTAPASSGSEDGRVRVWDTREGGVGADVGRLRALASAVLDDMGVPEAMAVEVWCVGRDEMAALNAAHLGGDDATDVLAFPLDAPGETPDGVPEILGDVVLCPEVAAAQADEAGKPARAELEMLLVHGLLHLLGYDHQEPDERREMFGLTDRLLEAWAGGAA